MPILSKAALEPFADLNAQSGCDNVFLEHRLALERQARGKIKRIFPIFVGERKGSGHQRSFGDANPAKILRSCEDRAVLVPAVERKVTEHLRRKGYRRQRLVEQQGAQATTVSAVVRALTKNQGELLGGTHEAAIARLVASVQRMVTEETAQQRGDPESSRRSTEACYRSEEPSRRSGELSQPPARNCLRHWFFWRRRWLLPDEVVQLELTDRSSPGSSVPESSVAPHGVGKQGALAGFFSSIVHEEEGEKVVNPLLVHRAKQTREAERKKPAQAAGGKFRTGGLARLDDTPRLVQSDEQQVDQYLNRHERVKTSVRHSAVEVDKLQATMDHRRASRNLTRREVDRRQSQVARARGGTSLQDSVADV